MLRELIEFLNTWHDSPRDPWPLDAPWDEDPMNDFDHGWEDL